MTPRDKKPKLGIGPAARKWPSIEIAHIEKSRNRIGTGWQTLARESNPAGCPSLSIKFYWNIATLICLCCAVYSCFCATMAKLSNCNESYCPQNLKYLRCGLSQKKFADFCSKPPAHVIPFWAIFPGPLKQSSFSGPICHSSIKSQLHAWLPATLWGCHAAGH